MKYHKPGDRTTAREEGFASDEVITMSRRSSHGGAQEVFMKPWLHCFTTVGHMTWRRVPGFLGHLHLISTLASFELNPAVCRIAFRPLPRHSPGCET